MRCLMPTPRSSTIKALRVPERVAHSLSLRCLEDLGRRLKGVQSRSEARIARAGSCIVFCCQLLKLLKTASGTVYLYTPPMEASTSADASCDCALFYILQTPRSSWYSQGPLHSIATARLRKSKAKEKEWKWKALGCLLCGSWVVFGRLLGDLGCSGRSGSVSGWSCRERS